MRNFFRNIDWLWVVVWGFIIAVVALITLVFIAAFTPLNAEGTITYKYVRPPYTSTSVVSVGNGVMVPINSKHKEAFKLELDEEREITVDRKTYDSYEVGDYIKIVDNELIDKKENDQ